MKLMNKELLNALRKDINAALEAVGKKHGVQLHAANATYTDNTARYQLKVLGLDADGKPVDPDREYLLGRYELLGLRKEHLEQVFRAGNMQVRLYGYNAKARAKPYIIRDVATGRNYVAPDFLIKRGLGIHAPAPFTPSHS